AKVTEKPAPEPTTTKPAEVVTAPASEPAKIDAAIPRPEPANVQPPTDGDFKPNAQPTATDAATASPAPAGNTSTPEGAKEPVKAASNVPPADQPAADKLRDMFGAKSLRYLDRKADRAAVEKFYALREYAPIWTAAGKLTDGGKGVMARLKDAASEGLNPSDYPMPDFAAAATPDALA